MPAKWRSERRQRTELLAWRVTPAERAQLAQAAAERGVSVAQIVRERVFG